MIRTIEDLRNSCKIEILKVYLDGFTFRNTEDKFQHESFFEYDDAYYKTHEELYDIYYAKQAKNAALAYVVGNTHTPDGEQLDIRVEQDKDGETLFIASPKNPNADVKKLFWPAFLQEEITKVVFKKSSERDIFEKAIYDKAYSMFLDYCCSPEAFADFDNYKRFVESFNEDFFGFD